MFPHPTHPPLFRPLFYSPKVFQCGCMVVFKRPLPGLPYTFFLVYLSLSSLSVARYLSRRAGPCLSRSHPSDGGNTHRKRERGRQREGKCTFPFFSRRIHLAAFRCSPTVAPSRLPLQNELCSCTLSRLSRLRGTFPFPLPQ